MRWKKVEGSGDIEDRRGESSSGGLGGPVGGMGLPPLGKAGGGLGMVVMLVVVALFLLSDRSGSGDSGLTPGLDPGPAADSTSAPPGGDTAVEFTKFVSKDVQDYWQQVFARSDKSYTRAPVVLFSSGTVSGCGVASAQTGPFYCPADNKVYLDLAFFTELARRFGAPGDFAAAYVIAHELGHHVQDLLGIEATVREKQQENPASASKWSVALELQADCFAGVWANSAGTKGYLEPGDIDEGLAAAKAVGDDRLGARSKEQWTHGSSELRQRWFKKGYDTGDAGECNTFEDVDSF